jgi:hypothetical protein
MAGPNENVLAMLITLREFRLFGKPGPSSLSCVGTVPSWGQSVRRVGGGLRPVRRAGEAGMRQAEVVGLTGMGTGS